MFYNVLVNRSVLTETDRGLTSYIFIPCACSNSSSHLVLHQLLFHTLGRKPSNTSIGSWRAWFLGVSSCLFFGTG
jgi:hypothetical protein